MLESSICKSVECECEFCTVYYGGQCDIGEGLLKYCLVSVHATQY
jgi:hypothetical protein